MITANALARSTPESQGLASAAILAFVDAVEQKALGLHGLMLLRHGRVVAEGWWEPYRSNYPHMLFSLSKSFTSTAVGLLVAEGKLNVDDPVLQFFADETPKEPSANLRAMRVRHLLTMTTGHDTEPPRDDPSSWTAGFLRHPVVHEPGTHFLYNTAGTHMLSAIVQRLTGQRLLHYLQPRLFAPLDIENPTWEMLPPGVDAGGFGLSVTTEDVARFGQLYLQHGMWEGKQLVPAAWVEDATKAQVPSHHLGSEIDWSQGYGYQFWRCRHDAYRGDGACGQYCTVMPDQDAVLAITAGLQDMPGVLNLVWEHLLPAMSAAALPADKQAHGALSGRLEALAVPTQAGRLSSPVAAEVTGLRFALPENDDQLEAMGVDFDSDNKAVLVIRNTFGEQGIPCGYGTWKTSAASLTGPVPTRIAACGAWTDERTFVAQVCLCESPFICTYSCRFEGERVHVERRLNVSFGRMLPFELEGQSL